MQQPPLYLRIIPPLWMLIFLVLGYALHYLMPAVRVFDFFIPTLSALVAVGVFLGGWAVSWRASYLFAEAKTEVLPTSPKNSVLVTEGPYRYSRNPMYFGLLLILLGIAIYIGTLPLFVATTALFLVLNFLFIPFEEEKMARQFGERYEAYKRSVRRWI